MVVQASLRIHHHGCVSEQLVGELTLTQLSGERGWDLFVLHAPPEEMERAFRIVCSNGTPPPTIIERTASCIIFRGQNLPRGIMATIRESRCWIQWPVIYRDGREFLTLGAPDRSELRRLVTRLEEHGTVEIDRFQTVAPERADINVALAELTSEMTLRQLEAILLAGRHGQYESRRGVTTEQLAALVNVSGSTFREHLAKGERALARAFIRLVTRQPASARAAVRARGRPPRLGSKRREREDEKTLP